MSQNLSELDDALIEAANHNGGIVVANSEAKKLPAGVMQRKFTLRSKSIHQPASPDDGIRICVMRRIKADFDFDVWLPALAPSNELLDAYRSGETDWDNFERLFQKEVLENEEKKPYLEMLQYLCEHYAVTLLCHEETDEKCHRRLLIEKIR
jgi:uncharacterized protein YeaO (DUF488 family)